MKRLFIKRFVLAMVYLMACCCALWANGVNRMVKHYGLAEGLPSAGVNCLALDGRGFVWIGATSGLTRFDGSHFRTFAMPSGGAGSFVYSPRSLAVDGDNRLWIGTKRGLYCFDTTKETFRKLVTGGLSDSSYVRHLAIDSVGRILAQTDTQCFSIDPNTFAIERKNTKDIRKRFLDKSRELVQQAGIGNVTCMQQGRDGRLWVGTFFDGLFCIHPDTVPFEVLNYGTNDNRLLIVRQISPWKDRTYVGTENAGLFRIERRSGERQFLKPVPLVWNGETINSGNVQSVVPIGGMLWIGMSDRGIYVMEPGSECLTRHYTAADCSQSGLISDNIVCLFETRSGDVMVGTGGGLAVWSKEKGRFERVKGSKHGMVHAIAERKDGSVWVGYLEESMQRLDKKMDGTWVANDAGFDHKCVTALLNSPDGTLWIGTDCKGVWKMSGNGTFAAAPLTYDVMKSSANTMIFDADGNLWVSTNRGLFCYDVAHEKLVHFTASVDGLPSDQMSFFSGYLAPNGSLLMGTFHGLVVFLPSTTLQEQSIPLHPCFTNVRIGQRDTIATAQLTLDYDAPSIRIDYGVPSYGMRRNVWFRYRLENAPQDEWTIVQGDEQSIYVSHLSPGGYKLVLQASLQPNEWDETVQAEMHIHVRPPFWLSLWGIAIYVVVATIIAILLLGVWRNRIEHRNLREQVASLLRNQELMRNTQATSPYDLIRDIAKNKTDNHLMEQIDEFLERNCTNQQLQVELLAEYLNMSKSTLYRRMRDVTSLSPNEYIRLFRLKKAAHLLREEGMAIREVSEMLCFSSVGYFTNSFSQQFGITPGEYVKQG